MISAADKISSFSYAIRNIVGAAEELERSGRQVTYLNIGDPQVFGFRPPEHLIEAVQRALRDRFTGYAHSTGLFEAKESIASYASSLGVETEPADVVVTAGASEAADLVLTALLNPGDEVLLPAPGYPLYSAILSKVGAHAVPYNLKETNDWQPSADEIATLINKRTKAILLINPNNPTGSITPDAVVTRILELAEKNKVLVIADEVYRELCFSDAPTSASVLARDSSVALVTLESLSKTHLIPGWRAGWMRFTNRDQMRALIGAINRLASGRLCSPTPAQYAIKPALEGDWSCVRDFLKEIRTRRDCAVTEIGAIDGLSCTTPEAAFYLMVRVESLKGRTDEEFVREMLESTGVLVVHGSGFGCDPHEGYFRLVYLADEPTLSTSLNAIEQFITGLPDG